MDLHCIEDATRFYDDRYVRGYMDEWSTDIKDRVLEIVRSCNLPARGRALDFGCGNGVLTDVLKEALPGWDVCGADISSVAVENARQRFPHCTFSTLDEILQSGESFDLVFSHHVLEHVSDLETTWDQLASLSRDSGWMLHVLPCGNAGSFEHWLCSLRTDGIDPQRGNRFYFEDEGHLRRLNTSNMASWAHRHGFVLAKEQYRNQYYGALEWITGAGSRFIKQLTNTRHSADPKAARILRDWRLRLLLLHRLRSFCRKKPNRNLGNRIINLARLILYPLGLPVDWYLRRQADHEWNTRRHERTGSEMFLLFARGMDQRPNQAVAPGQAHARAA